MPYSLKGRNVLVTGGSRGLGALICEKFAAEGCNVAINYNESKDRAEQLVSKITKEHGIRALAIQGDVGLLTDCERLVKEAVDGLEGLDIIVANAGYTVFAPFTPLTSPPFPSESDWDKCYAVNVKSHVHILRAALPTLTANADGGVYLTTASIAGVSVSGSSMPYSVTKAAGLHLVKCLAATQGPKIRVNAVLPGLLLTEWGDKFGEEKIQSIKGKSYLGKETNLEDTADMFVAVAKNSSMTGQFVQIDSGLAMLGRAA